MKKSSKIKYLPVYLKKILWLLVFAAYSIPCTGESIAIVTISTKNRVSFSQYTLSSLMKYASKWGYYLYFYPNLDQSCNLYWNKVKVMLDLLREGKHTWYVWFDDDVFITNPEISIEKIIQNYSRESHVIFSSFGSDEALQKNKYSVNSGIFVIKNSDWSKNFLEEWWGKRNDYGTEEYGLGAMLPADKYKDSPYISIICGRRLQSHLMLVFKGNVDHYQWQPGDFAAHLAGACERVRYSICKQFSINPNIYPELPEGLEDFTIKQEPSSTYYSDCQIYNVNAEKAILSGKSAVSYKLHGGLLEDNLIAYLHAKWISYKYKIPLLYVPFKYSDKIAIDVAELARKKYSANNVKKLCYDTVNIDPNNAILYEVPWFPEASQQYEYKDQEFVQFKVNWDDKEFIADARRFIKPRVQLNLLQIPSDKISVAVCVQGRDSQADTKELDNFYVAQINQIYESFNRQPIYVYVFTEDNNPAKIARAWQNSINNPNITIDYRHENIGHDTSVLEDFFSMLKFDCLIHSNTNFSFIVSKIGSYKVVASPTEYTIKNNHTKTVRANIATNV